MLNRLVCVPFEPLRLAHPTDRDYASQELTAFCLSWLYALPPPVLNRATPQGLAGPWRHRSEWLWLAACAGLPTPLYRETSEDPRDERDGQGRLVPSDTPVQTVFVVADQVVGATLPRHIRHGCRRLAELSHTALLGDCPRISTSGMWVSLRHAVRASRWPHPRNATEPLDSKKLLLRRSDTLPRAIAAS